MTHIIKAITFAILILLIAGCKKEALKDSESNRLIFEGTVYDPTNEEYLLSKVSIIHNCACISLSPETLISEFLTDIDGNYSYSFDGEEYKNNHGYFEVRAHRVGYLSDNADGRKIYYSVDSTNFGIPFSAALLLRPKAEIEFWLKVPYSPSHGDLKYSIRYRGKTREYGVLSSVLLEQRRFVHQVGAEENISISYAYKNGDVNGNDTFLIETGERKVVEILE